MTFFNLIFFHRKGGKERRQQQSIKKGKMNSASLTLFLIK